MVQNVSKKTAGKTAKTPRRSEPKAKDWRVVEYPIGDKAGDIWSVGTITLTKQAEQGHLAEYGMTVISESVLIQVDGKMKETVGATSFKLTHKEVVELAKFFNTMAKI